MSFKEKLGKAIFPRLHAKSEEVGFWEFYFGRRGYKWKDDYERRVNPETPLKPEIAEIVDRVDGDKVSILDVGSGPITIIGYKHTTKEVRVKPTDELAESYDRILKINGIKPPKRTIFAKAENLTKYVKVRGYHIATCINALDHTTNPKKVILEMLNAVKHGGYVYLNHCIKEADEREWEGEHQWNIFKEGEDMVIEGARRRFLLSEIIGENKIEYVRQDTDKRIVETLFKKV